MSTETGIQSTETSSLNLLRLVFIILKLVFHQLRPFKNKAHMHTELIVQELCESRGGRPGLSVLRSLLVSVDVKLY